MFTLQGSYILMDADYGRNLDVSGHFTQEFEQSLYILTTVMSVTVSLVIESLMRFLKQYLCLLERQPSCSGYWYERS
jgi:hypothetical protein